jgi:cytidylate kinase
MAMSTRQTVITISREEGSGGREIAQQLARKFKFSYIDNQIIQLVSRQLGLTEEQLTQLEGQVLPKLTEMSKLITESDQDESEDWVGAENKINQTSSNSLSKLAEADHNSKIWRNYQILAEKLIQEVARQRSVVILGRGANFALKSWPNAVNVFVHAPLKERIERVAYLERINPDEAARRITQLDEQRAAYVRQYYDADWHSPDNYHLVVNTCGIPLSDITASIYQFIKEFNSNRHAVNRLDIYRSYETLATKQNYTPKEAAEFTFTSPYLIRSAVRRGELKGTIVDHRVMSISREALMDWMSRR